MQDGNLKFHLEEKEKKEGGKKQKPKITPIDCDILIDLSPMNKVLQVDQASKQATVEGGITIANLQSELQRHGFALECLPQTKLSYDEATLASLVAEDSLCLESGYFNNSLERMSFFTGKGEAIQSGGYNLGSRPAHQFGIDLSHLLFGTNHNLGIPYEMVLNVKPRHEVEKQRYLYHSSQFHGFDQMAEAIGDLSREISKYTGVYIKKPIGLDIKELIKVTKAEG